jgi:hypothetical protein
MGDKWTEYRVYHHNVQEYLKKFETEEVPAFFTESDKIDWKRRVEIQGVIQKYIDHSISSTINLPKGTSPDVVSELYLLGWKLGLKGVTVYVDGSRDGVLITETKKESFPQYNAPKRPVELSCDIHNLTIKGEKWTILVGLLEGRPYEVMGGLAELVEMNSLLLKNNTCAVFVALVDAESSLPSDEMICRTLQVVDLTTPLAKCSYVRDAVSHTLNLPEPLLSKVVAIFEEKTGSSLGSVVSEFLLWTEQLVKAEIVKYVAHSGMVHSDLSAISSAPVSFRVATSLLISACTFASAATCFVSSASSGFLGDHPAPTKRLGAKPMCGSEAQLRRYQALTSPERP